MGEHDLSVPQYGNRQREERIDVTLVYVSFPIIGR